jgi:invasion protein IalB
MGVLMNKMSCRFQLAVGLLLLASSVLAPTRQAQAQLTYTPPIKQASLSEDGKPIPPGDLLRTTRTFPNWNLNCEVLLSQGKHICTAELRAIDPQGRQILSWSFALSADNTPIIVVKVPADIVQSYGVLMLMGADTKFFVPTRADCNPMECVQVALLDDNLRNMIASQKQVTFSFMRAKEIFRIDAPLAGLSEALDAARRDPVGLVAVQQAAAHASAAARKPAVTAMAKPAK